MVPSEIVSVDGYSFYRKDRDGRGGGIGVYINNEIKCEQIIITNYIDDDASVIAQLWLKLQFRSSTVALGILYRPPKGNLPLAVEALDTLLSHLSVVYDHILVLGDVNVNMFNINNKITLCFESYCFKQIIVEPTRITSSTETLLDPIFTTFPERCTNSGTLNTDVFTDHRLVYCETHFEKARTPQKFVTFRDFKKFNHENFMADLLHVNWSDIVYLKNIDDKVTFLNDHILALFDTHAPLRSVRVNKPSAPWLTPNLRAIYKQRDDALSKYKQNRTEGNWKAYAELRNFALSCQRREKYAYLQHLQKTKNSSLLFKGLKSMNIQNKKSNDIPAYLRNPEKINEYFLSVFQNNTIECAPEIEYYDNNKFDESFHFDLVMTTEEEIYSLLFKVKSNACGHDGITPDMIKLCFPVIGKYLTHLINTCIEMHYFPFSWRQAVVIPLPKINNPTAYSDLRPISLLPILSKVFEKLVYNQLKQYCFENSIIPVNQSGFKAGNSTTTTLLKVTDDIVGALDKSQAAALVLLDLSKAFDTINHPLLISKCKFFGFSENSIKFLKSYLMNRKQRVSLDNSNSSFKNVISGVPQGSILGPLLFSIYISDICKMMHSSEVMLFADDTQIYKTFDPEDCEAAIDELNRDLAAIVAYSKRSSLTLNPSKSKAILFAPKTKILYIKSRTKVLIESSPLVYEDSVSDLGVVIDKELRFREHVSKLVKSCFITLKILFANRHVLNYSLKKNLCECLVLSKINYGLIVFYPYLDQVSARRLQLIQNTCCRLIYGLRKYDHVSPCFAGLKWLDLKNCYRYNMLTFIQNLILTSIPDYLFKKIVFRQSMRERLLRYNKLLEMPQHRSALFTRCFSYNTVKLYNFLPDLYKDMSLNKFKFSVKQYLLSSSL
nr:unnamed protein product [Callosobruchus analis]